MKKYLHLTFKDLSRMDQLLKTPSATTSANNELTELDQLAIKVVNDLKQHPNRRFYNLRNSSTFNNGIAKRYLTNSEEPLDLSFKR